MSNSKFIDVCAKIKCPMCGYLNTTPINLAVDGMVRFVTCCGTPPQFRGKKYKQDEIEGCGKDIFIKGIWSFKIEEISKVNEPPQT